MMTGPDTSPYDLVVIYRNYALGGVERHTVDLLKYLATTDLRVVLLESGFDLRSIGLEAVPGRLDIVDTGLPLRRLSFRERRAWSRLLRTYQAPRILVVKPGFVAVDAGFMRIVRKAAPQVYHFEHSLVPPVTRGSSKLHFGFLPGLGLYWRLEPCHRRRMSRLVDRVFIDSEAGKRSLMEHAALADDQVVACLNGLDLSQWAPGEKKAAAFRAQHGLPQDCYLFGSAGRLDPLKGIELALQSFALLRQRGMTNSRLCIVGQGPSRASLEELTRSLQLQNHVVFTGFVDDISAAYAAFDTLLFPSELESCPLVMLEAMACGCRILASPIGGIPEILRDPQCGELVSGRDPDNWAERMQAHVQTPPSRRRELAAHVRDYVLTNHDQRQQFRFLAGWFGARRFGASPEGGPLVASCGTVPGIALQGA